MKKKRSPRLPPLEPRDRPVDGAERFRLLHDVSRIADVEFLEVVQRAVGLRMFELGQIRVEDRVLRLIDDFFFAAPPFDSGRRQLRDFKKAFMTHPQYANKRPAAAKKGKK